MEKRHWFNRCLLSVGLLSGMAVSAIGQPLSPFTASTFTPNGNIGEFINFGGDSQEYFVAFPDADPEFGKIKAGATLANGVFVARDIAPGAGAFAAGPSGFRDNPGNNGATSLPTGFNVGRMFVSFNPNLDPDGNPANGTGVYFIAMDVSAPAVMDTVANTQPVAFDVDGNGSMQNQTEIAPENTVGEVPQNVPDEYRFILDTDVNGTSNVQLVIAEGDPAIVPIGAFPLGAPQLVANGPGAADDQMVQRYAQFVGVNAAQVIQFFDWNNNGAIDTGDFGVGADLEIAIRNVTALPGNADPFCTRFRVTADSFDDRPLGGGAEDLVEITATFPRPRLEVTKEVRCADDPNSVFARNVDALPGSTVEFRITIRNEGNTDLTNIQLTDDLTCILPADADLVPGSVTTIGPVPAGIIANFATQFENRLLGNTFPLNIGTLLGPAAGTDMNGDGLPDTCPAGTGESLQFTFRATLVANNNVAFCDNAEDCSNAVSATAEASVDPLPVIEEEDGVVADEFDILVQDDDGVVDTVAETAAGADDNVVSIEIECRDVTLIKEVRADLNNDGDFNDPGEGFTSCNNPVNVSVFPIRLEYRYTARNLGEVTERINIRDDKLCDDVNNIAGFDFQGACGLCGGAGFNAELAPNNGVPGGPDEVSVSCIVVIQSQAAFDLLDAADDDPDVQDCIDASTGCPPPPPGVGADDDCYINCATMTSTVVQPAPPAPPICDGETLVRNAYAMVCSSTCLIEVDKQVRCLEGASCSPSAAQGPGTNPDDHLGNPNTGWVGIGPFNAGDPVHKVAPGACLQYRIIVENTSSQTICKLQLNDLLSFANNFTSVPFDIQVVPPAGDPAVTFAPPLNVAGANSIATVDLDPGDRLVILFKVRVKNAGDAGLDISQSPNNTVRVDGAFGDAACVSNTFTCTDQDNVPIDITTCNLSVDKTVQCLSNCTFSGPGAGVPIGAPADSVDALPGSCLRFSFTITNNPVAGEMPLTLTEVCLRDNLTCGSWFKAGTVRATYDAAGPGGVVDVTGSFAAFAPDNVERCFPLPPGAQLNVGDTLTVTFDVQVPPGFATIGNDPDCTNTVFVKGLPDICLPVDGQGNPQGPCSDDDNAFIDVRIPRVQCNKTVALDATPYGSIDEPPANNCATNLYDVSSYTYPVKLVYTMTVDNVGETGLVNLCVVDNQLLADAAAAGATVLSCALDQNGSCSAAGSVGALIPGPLAPADPPVSITCEIEFDSESELLTFVGLDGNADGCYENMVTVTATPDTANLCAPPAPIPTVSSTCSACFCIQACPVCPPITKVVFQIWNENESSFAGNEFCLNSWDQRLFSEYQPGENIITPQNLFLKSVLHTDMGRARINAVNSQLCPDSLALPLLGVAAKVIQITPDNAAETKARAGTALVGSGFELGRIRYDLPNAGHDDGGVKMGKGAPPLPSVASTSKKGSFIVWPKVEIKWNAAGELIQDTILTLSNDATQAVDVQLYYVNGDPCECNWSPVDITLTRNQPMYWSAATGDPGPQADGSGSLTPFTILDEDGIPDPDPRNPGGRMLRGYVIGWAIDAEVEEINWNHLYGDAVLINYAQNTSWDYTAWAFAALAGAQGQKTSPAAGGGNLPGLLEFDGFEFDFAPDRLLLNFHTLGSAANPNNGLSTPSATVRVDTDLTLWAVFKNLSTLDLNMPVSPPPVNQDDDRGMVNPAPASPGNGGASSSFGQAP